MARSKRSRARREKRRLKAAVQTGIIDIPARNPVALAACIRSGAGRHTDRKKEARRMACRKPVAFLCPAGADHHGSSAMSHAGCHM